MRRLINDFVFMLKSGSFWFGVFIILGLLFVFFISPVETNSISYVKGEYIGEEIVKKKYTPPPLDKVEYDSRMTILANNPILPEPLNPSNDGSGEAEPKYDEEGNLIPPLKPDPFLWPKENVYPNGGALLPFNRIIAYYGNLYSTKMGILGEYKEDVMLAKLQEEVSKWELADPDTPVIAALHYIAVVAQADKGADGKYRARMPEAEIEKVLAMAEKINAIVFLDIQVGFSTVQDEIPHLRKYLELPNVHLGLDPEFSMKTGIKPGKIVGTMDGEEDINFAINYLSGIVKEKELSPKILVVHRYTQKMLTNTSKITPTAEVQVVVHMDGWGGKQNKISTYQSFIYPEPVQFTGFKIFYKNDVKESNTVVFEPEELMKLNI